MALGVCTGLESGGACGAGVLLSPCLVGVWVRSNDCYTVKRGQSIRGMYFGFVFRLCSLVRGALVPRYPLSYSDIRARL